MLDIAHLHTFKCAGTTFMGILEHNYPKQVAYVESRDGGSRIAWQRFGSEIDIAGSRVLTSHLMSMPGAGSGLAKIIVGFVRNPVDRIISAYTFSCLQSGKAVNQSDFLTFLRGMAGTIGSNFQTRHLSPQDDGGWEARNGWQLRPELIDLSRPDVLIGTVERFAETMVILEHRAQALGFEFDGAYPGALNTTERSTEVDPSVVHDELIEIDQVLHLRANRALDAQISQISDMDARLADFYVRCEKTIAISKEFRPEVPKTWRYID